MQIIRISEVIKQTGLSSASVYKQIRLGLFPKPVKITARASGWCSSQVDAWINSKLDQNQAESKDALELTNEI